MVVQFFIQMISANQDSKLTKTVKKCAISLIYQFLFSISKKNFWFQRTLASFAICQEFWTKDRYFKIYRRWNVGTAGKVDQYILRKV